MGSLLDLGWARLQFGLHLLALLLGLAAIFVPVLARPAGLLLALAGLVLGRGCWWAWSCAIGGPTTPWWPAQPLDRSGESSHR